MLIIDDFQSTSLFFSFRPLKPLLILWVCFLLSLVTLNTLNNKSLWIVMLQYYSKLEPKMIMQKTLIQDFAFKIVVKKKLFLNSVYCRDYLILAGGIWLYYYFQFSASVVSTLHLTQASIKPLDRLVTITQERTMQKQQWLVSYCCHSVLIFG